MKIKLDENIPTSLAQILAQFGHDVDTVADEGLNGERDDVVWQETQGAGRFLITQDLDFSDVHRYVPGSHHGILVVRLREPGRENLIRHVQAAFVEGDPEKWHGCFIVLTDRKTRIRRPSADDA